LTFPVDHTIDVYVNDSGGNPVEIVQSDIWLENVDAEPCPGGWIADSSTFAPDAGHTTFTGVLRGGVPLVADCNDSTDVVAIGNTIQTLPLFFISPDLNGDGTVDSIDFAVFASCFNLPCVGHCPCADLDKGGGDPCVTSVDFAIFASFFNLSDCP
jgi:hypothetical protein